MPALLSRIVLAGAVVACVCACRQKTGKVEIELRHNKDGRGTPVARFGGDSITAEEVRQRFAEMSPYARARYQTPEQKKEYVEGLARFEILASEAVKRGLAKDPEVAAAVKKAMVQRLLRIENEEKAVPIADSAVTQYYEKHKTDYVKPEMVRLSHIFFAAPRNQASLRKQKQAKAQQVLTKAKTLPPFDSRAFAELVKENSEEPRTKPSDGDMRFLTIDDLSSQYGAEVSKAAASLSQMGQIASELVETDKGFHILKLQARQTALNLTVDQAKTQIQNILLREARLESFRTLLASLVKAQQLQIDDAELAKIQVDLKAPALETKGPTPGFIPAPPAPRSASEQ